MIHSFPEIPESVQAEAIHDIPQKEILFLIRKAPSGVTLKERQGKSFIIKMKSSIYT